MTQSIKASVAGLLAACESMYADLEDPNGGKVLVCEGLPGAYQPDAVVMVGTEVRQSITRPTMGTSRSREIRAEIDVEIDVYVPGSETSQVTATDMAHDMVELLDAHFRTSPDETLDGGCRDAWVSAVRGPIPSVATDAGANATGRIATAVCTVTALIRH